MKSNEPDLMTTAEVAAYLRIPVGTLRQWRYHNRGPRSFRVGGRRVMYRRNAVEEYLKGCEATTGLGESPAVA